MTYCDWALVNSLWRFVLTMFLSYKLLCYGDMLNRMERIGMGVMGGSAFLTIAVVLDTSHQGTPFDGWSTFLLTTGCNVYFFGRMTRHWRHRVNNQQMLRMAQHHFARRAGDR